MTSVLGADISELLLSESTGLTRLLLLSMLKMWPSGKCVIKEFSNSSFTLSWNFEPLLLSGLQLVAWPNELQ